MMTEAEFLGPFDLGKGYQGCLMMSPLTGQTYVAESETGAIVGNTIAQVCHDIEEGDDKVMERQMADAREAIENAEHVSPEVFWRRMKDAR